MRYKISPHIEFSAGKYSINDSTSGNKLVIINKNNNTSFYINDTIQAFIQKFEIPKTFKIITGEISKELNITTNQVKKIITPFFNYCKYRQFILPEKDDGTSDTQKPLFEANSVVDKYKIEKIIDATADIDIYKAVDPDSEMPVIIKLLKKNSAENIAALKREYDFLLRLNNTNVAPNPIVFAEQENYTWFAQEFIEGSGLPQFITNNKNVSQKHITSLVKKIIDAFAKIHIKGIVHGDIHPGNIIVTPSSEIKVLDFGLALNYDLEKNENLNFGGAYFFMPPERIKTTTYKKFAAAPDFFSDVFQSGIVLFKLLYDAYPFNGITWEELAREIKEKDICFPDKACYGFIVPDTIKEIIRNCVAKKQHQRFADATAIQSAFLLKRSSDANTIKPAVKI